MAAWELFCGLTQDRRAYKISCCWKTGFRVYAFWIWLKWPQIGRLLYVYSWYSINIPTKCHPYKFVIELLWTHYWGLSASKWWHILILITDQDVLYLVLATLDVVKHHVLEDVLAVLQLVHLVVRVRVEHRPAKELSQRLQWGETLSSASGGMWGGQQLRQGWVFIEPCSYIFLHFYWICMMLKNAMLFICFFIKNKNNTMKICIVDN